MVFSFVDNSLLQYPLSEVCILLTIEETWCSMDTFNNVHSTSDNNRQVKKKEELRINK